MLKFTGEELYYNVLGLLGGLYASWLKSFRLSAGREEVRSWVTRAWALFKRTQSAANYTFE
jgi:hypothetical protein